MLSAQSISSSQWNPPPKQGCEIWENGKAIVSHDVSVEPPPKQGCEAAQAGEKGFVTVSQWNPRRSRGARSRMHAVRLTEASLSGTPAEAGVRVKMIIK